MGYWTPDTLGVRLAQLMEDLSAIARHARGLNAAIGADEIEGPGGQGYWADFADAMAGRDQVPPSHLERLAAHAARLRRADDQDLAEAHGDVSETYESLHMALPVVEPFFHTSLLHNIPARELYAALTVGEDEAHRVLSGYGDLRRDRRRAAL